LRYVQQHGQLHYRQRWLRSGLRFGDGYLPDTHSNTGGESNTNADRDIHPDANAGGESDAYPDFYPSAECDSH